MDTLFLLSPFAGAALLIVVGRWLERVTKRPGLFFLIGACVMVLGAAIGLIWGRTTHRLLAVLYILQALGFFYAARWRRDAARVASVPPHDG